MTETRANLTQLASAFEPASEAQWREMALKALRGAPFDRLVSKTHDGIEIQPLYQRAASAPAPARRANENGWTIFTRIDHPGAQEAAAQAREDLENGAQGLHLVFAGSAGDLGFGLPPDGALVDWLGGADAAACAFLLDGAHPAQAFALADMIAASGLDPAQARATFGLDPLGALVRGRRRSEDFGANMNEAAQCALALHARGIAGPFLAADGRIIHAAGGSEAQELAFVAASAAQYLRALEAAGASLSTARSMIELRVAADADQFLTVSKLRALRLIWRRIEEACGLDAQPAVVFAETAWRMMSRADARVNFLRTSVAAFSAAVGGAEAISVLPFSQAHGLPDAFARRMARNTQIILAEECHAGHVCDPAAGSGAIEALTQEIAVKAWSVFQSIEAQGGLAEIHAREEFAQAVGKVRDARMKNVALRREQITGVNEFPNLAEITPDVLAPLTSAPKSGPFAPLRLAEAFETRRSRAAKAALPPKIFLACIGEQTDFAARAGFARNLFEAGGIIAVDAGGFDDAQDAAEAFARSGAQLACLCASDALYGDHAGDFARALLQAGARQIWLAGKPGEQEAAWRAAGVHGFVFAGCDALAAIDTALTGAGA